VSALSGVPELPAAGPARAAARGRRLLVLAGAVAGVSCLFFLAVALLIVLPATRGYIFGGGPNVFSALVWTGLIAATGLATALVIAIVAQRPPSVTRAQPDAYGSRARRTSSLAIAGAVAGVSCMLLLAMMFLVVVGRAGGYVPGYAFSTKAMLAVVGLLAVAGLIAALVLALMAVRRRVTSLRTRAFVVIIVAMVIPALLLAGLGTYAYFMSWERATVLYTDQASYQARELSSEIAELSKTPGRYTPAERALLSRAITDQYGAQNHLEGALWSTLSAVRQEKVLPVWAVRGLERRGFVIGGAKGPTSPERAEFVAWRVGPSTVRYYMQGWSGTPFMDAYAPLGRLLWIALFGLALIAVLGLLGAWILSRSVVRPVRRLAEASHRIADAGGAAEPVNPQGPRELRELATSFNDMNAKLAKAQETEQAFLLSVSHELKTPLTSIRGYAEGIGDGTVKPPDGAAVIGAESSRLERLVGDLLDSGRMRKSAFTVRREAVDLAALAQDVVRRYEGTARDAGLTLHMNTDAGGSAVADNDRLLQVVSNLVENAIRCTPAPGTVTITTKPGAVTVADTGRGLTSDDLPRAFERFYLYSRYGNDRLVGTGLGLAIVKELTEAMGGTVSVSSAVGVGTAFTAVLPQDVMPSTVALPRDDEASTVAVPRDDAS
jgi:signal transduction histidine kinase